MHCTADICLIPIGTGETSVSRHIAECQRVLEKSGLKYQMHGYGTGIEGEFSDVTAVIQKMHEAVHAQGVARIASDIRIGTRLDKAGSLAGKIESVEKLLAQDKQGASGSAQPPSQIALPPADPRQDLERKVSETRQFLFSPAFEVPGKDV
ncbi:hypothetical protein JCM10207_008745 [Rhodosporidiobolus poonsookiae]